MMNSYRGWDRDAMEDSRPGDNADLHSDCLLPSSFTAINQSPTLAQPLTPEHTAPSSTQIHRAPAPKTRPKKRNRAVAEYLGLDAGRETLLFGDAVEASAPDPQKAKRIKLKTANRVTQDTKHANQRRISDGLRATKPGSRRLLTPKDTQDGAFDAPSVPEVSPDLPVALSSATSSKLMSVRYEAPLSDANSTAHCPTNIAVTASRPFAQDTNRDPLARPNLSDAARDEPGTGGPAHGDRQRRSPQKADLMFKRTSSLTTRPGFSTGEESQPENFKLDDHLREQCKNRPCDSDCGSPDYSDEDIENIFSSLDPEQLTGHDYSAKHAAGESCIFALSDDELDSPAYRSDSFDDGLIDDDLLLLTSDPTIDYSTPNARNEGQHVHSDDRWQLSPVQHYESRPSTAVSSEATVLDRGPSSHFTSPVTSLTRTRSQGPKVERKPIVRPPFPQQTRDRSPIIGLSSNNLLRTCFRVGEAINTGCQAAKSGKSILIELYARVLTSKRDDQKQHFVLCDLYHRKPPYITAVYDAAIWKSVELFNFDSGLLLQENRMCRCIGKMRKDGLAWELVVLNIWPTTWEDIEWVEGIVNA